jgi:hypothetical protein
VTVTSSVWRSNGSVHRRPRRYGSAAGQCRRLNPAFGVGRRPGCFVGCLGRHRPGARGDHRLRPHARPVRHVDRSRQGLQHRMPDMQMHLEQACSMSYMATSSYPDPTARRGTLSATKMLMGQAARYIGQQAVQLRGGTSVTEELDHASPEVSGQASPRRPTRRKSSPTRQTEPESQRSARSQAPSDLLFHMCSGPSNLALRPPDFCRKAAPVARCHASQVF